MVLRVVLALAVAACTEYERTTDLAHLEVDVLQMYIGSNLMWGEVRPVRDVRDPCIMLGTDFTARIDTIELETDPGSREERCESEEDGCEDNTATCSTPYFSLSWPPPLETAELTIADDSHTLRCNLGNAFAPRTITRVGAGSWDVRPNEQVSVRISPASDVSRLVVKAYVVEPGRPINTLPHTIEGDVMTFTMPPLIREGALPLYVHLSGYDTYPCDVPTRGYHEYSIEQPINVLWW